MDKISIIIPVYNRENKIGRCLESIINQSYGNLEILCIDDYSTDNSLEILNKYAMSDSRIKIISLKQNGGVSNARNTGLSYATGDWIAFVDSDDYVENDMYEVLLAHAIKHSVDIVLSDLDMIVNGQHRNMKTNLIADKRYGQHEINTNILYKFSEYGENNLGIFSFSTKLYKRSLIENNNIRFDCQVSYEEDKLFVIECMSLCNAICYVDKAFYKYIVCSDGLFSDFNKKAWRWYISAYYKYLELIDKYQIKGVNDKYLPETFSYNLQWFLFRSNHRIKDKRTRKHLQKEIIENSDIQTIFQKIYPKLSSFDKRIAYFILKKQHFFTMLLIDFVYSGKKDKLIKFFIKA